MSNSMQVAATVYKLVRRNWVFRFFAVVALVLVGGYQLVMQSDLFRWSVSGVYTLSSMIPHVNALFFSILQVIPVVFLTRHFQSDLPDTWQVIDARPESNLEYIWGTAAGIILSVLRLACVSLLLAAGIHLFASAAPFNGWIYLYYLLVITLPTLVFVTGISLFVAEKTSHRGMFFITVLTVLVLFFRAFPVGLGYYYDPLAFDFPALFSLFTGQLNALSFFLQRLLVLLIGILLIFLTAGSFKRFPNKPGAPRSYYLIVCLLLLPVAGIIFRQAIMESSREKKRERWTASIVKHSNSRQALSVSSQEIDYTCEGSRMRCKASMTLINEGEDGVLQPVFYLNPALRILSLYDSDGAVTFQQDGVAVVVNREIRAGETVALHVEYTGEIDEQVCYLDASASELERLTERHYLLSRSGSSYAFQSKEYTLLFPEVLWYPVVHPPVNPRNPYDLRQDFTRFVLRVYNTGKQTAISQGKPLSLPDGSVEFRSEYPLTGISLCIGNYTCRTASVDGVDYNIYLHPGNEDLLKRLATVGDSLSYLIGNLRREGESRMERSYPFKRFSFVETPFSFASLQRNAQGYSNCVQPELFFFQERAVGMNIPDHRGLYKEQVHRQQSKEEFFADRLTEWFSRFTSDMCKKGDSRWGITEFLRKEDTWGREGYRLNPYALRPLFYTYRNRFTYGSYSMMDFIFQDILYQGTVKSDGLAVMRGAIDIERLHAIRYLNDHSLGDALQDPQLAPEVQNQILRIKSENIFNHPVFLQNGSPEMFWKRLEEYSENRPFTSISPAVIDSLSLHEFNCRLSEGLENWLHDSALPIYLVEGVSVTPTGADGDNCCLVTARIYNDSDITGVISLNLVDPPDANLIMSGAISPFARGTVTQYNYVIPPRSGREIALIRDGKPTRVVVDTKISRNLPAQLPFDRPPVAQLSAYEFPESCREWERVVEIPREAFCQIADGTTIVDNEDPGFRTIDPPARNAIQAMFQNKGPDQQFYMDRADLRLNMSKWVRLVDMDAYGDTSHTVAVRSGGKGKGKALWETTLPQSGVYEVSVYVGRMHHSFMTQMTSRFSPSKTGKITNAAGQALGGRGSIPVYNHYYAIYNHSDPVGESVVDIMSVADRGWKSLGTFRFEGGKVRVELSDRSDEEHTLICADAVKWEYKGQ